MNKVSVRGCPECWHMLTPEMCTSFWIWRTSWTIPTWHSKNLYHNSLFRMKRWSTTSAVSQNNDCCRTTQGALWIVTFLLGPCLRMFINSYWFVLTLIQLTSTFCVVNLRYVSFFIKLLLYCIVCRLYWGCGRTSGLLCAAVGCYLTGLACNEIILLCRKCCIYLIKMLIVASKIPVIVTQNWRSNNFI